MNNHGIRDAYLTHFISFKTIETALLEIIESGIYIEISNWLNAINSTYNNRIYREILLNFIYNEDEKLQEINRLNNFERVIKYNSEFKKPRRNNDESYIFLELFNSFNDKFADVEHYIRPNFIKMLKNTFNEYKSNDEFLTIVSDDLIFIKNKFKKSKILNHFKPIFYILFEDNEKQLHTELGFMNNEKLHYKYDGDYNSYFKSRIDTLMGFRRKPK